MMLPLKPLFFPFLVLILIAPELPEASYFDEGFVMISTWSSADAGILRRRLARSAADKKVCLPSIITMTRCLPRRLILPSLSTVMPGDFSIISRAVAPALVGEASTFTTVLSILVSINGFLAVTVTPSIDLDSVVSFIGSALRVALSAVISRDCPNLF